MNGIPAPNVTRAPRELHMEVMDPRTFDVWLHQDVVTMDDYAAFRPEPPFFKSGVGRGAMDSAWFLRSPGGAIDGALDTRVIGGREFVRVARPLDFRGLAKGNAPTRLSIDKHHVLGFLHGSEVRVARLPDGKHYVQQTVAAPGAGAVPLPADWEVSVLRPSQDWIVHVPTPATVYFFRNLDSYIGPVRLPPVSS
ncbi:MAG TPA: hypothetical protein VM240_05140 [Verrucomicrobiae bacterium]|nr:hypothetical protein [Verrucomicrobiae bacterium]